MVAFREIVRVTVVQFLPAVVALLIAGPLIELILRGHNVLESLKQLYLPIAFAEPLLISTGYALGLSLVRTKVTREEFRHKWIHLAAGISAIVTLGILSVFSQGAHLPFIIGASLCDGFLVTFLFRAFVVWHRVTATHERST